MNNTVGTTETAKTVNCMFDTLENASKNVDYVKYLKENAVRILGSAEYTRVHKFFKNNFLQSAAFDYIVVKARRAYMLAQIFGIILLYEFEQEKIAGNPNAENDYKICLEAVGKMHSDVFLSTMEFLEATTEKHKGLLILDDIIIHGRTLNELLENLLENTDYTVDDIRVNSVVVSKDAECFSTALKECLVKDTDNAPKYVDASAWKQLSNKFVALIQYSGRSYAAFTDAFECDAEYVPEKEFAYCVSGIESKAQLEANIKMQVYFKNEYKNLVGLNQCLRYYTRKSDKINAKIAIPFVSLPMMKVDKWREYYKDVALFNNSNMYIKHRADSVQEKLDVFAYKLISNIASNLYATQLRFTKATTNNLFGSFNIKVDSIEYNNVIKGVKELLKRIETENRKPIFACYTTDTPKDSVHPDWSEQALAEETDILTSAESVALWRSVLQQYRTEKVTQVQLRSMLTEYLDVLHSKNEMYAAKKQPRLAGIPLYALFVVLQRFNKQYNWCLESMDYRSFYAYAMSLWDVGIASYNVGVFTFNCEKYIGGCITDGEQAYHALMEKDSSAEVFAVHLLKYYTHSESEYQHKLNELFADIQYTDSMLDSKRLKNVCDYYEANHTVRELMHIYPATKQQQEALRKRITSLCGR